MDLSSFLTVTNGLIALIVFVTSSGAGLITWLYMRGRKDQKSDQVDLDTYRKVGMIEDDVVDLRQVLTRHSSRLGHIERQMETVARTADIAALREQAARIDEKVTAASNKTDTLYNAVLRASGGDK